jgi:ABC-2 type transport system ATP-binding protein
MRTATSGAPLLEAEHVAKRFGRNRVLVDASLTAWPGQVVAILGENGSGKSTLLNILAGTTAADRGRVRRAGAAGYCPQDCVLYPQLTPDEHFELFASAYRLTREHARRRADELYDKLVFGAHRRTQVQHLSGGTRQKLNLSLAVLHDPPLLLLDEPYSGFDIETYHRFVALSDDARAAGKAVILITHLVFERQRFDAIYRLREGGLHAEPV